MTIEKSDIATSVAELVKELYKLEDFEIGRIEHDDGETETLFGLLKPHGRELVDLAPLVERYQPHPRFRKGTTELTDLDSFIYHVVGYRLPETVLFASRNRETPSITAVYDYHSATGEAGSVAEIREKKLLPGHCRDRAVYRFPLASEYQAWLRQNGVMMEQAEFAHFLEDRALDVLPPIEHPQSDTEKELVSYAAKLGTAYASPQKLLELSRGLTIHSEDRVTGITNITSGEVQISYEEQHRDASGNKLNVPGLFLIGIPIFEGGAVYRIPVRLRYRKTGGGIKWFYEVFQLDRYVRDAIDEACKRAAEETSCPLMFGSTGEVRQ